MATTVISYHIDQDWLDKIENHIDQTKIKLRKKSKKFTKKDFFHYLTKIGYENFNINDFETFLEGQAAKQATN